MQLNLFSDSCQPYSYDEHQLGDADIREYPHAFSEEESSKILLSLMRQIPWQQDVLWIAGKKRPIPRLQCWMGDQGTSYQYSGLKLTPTPWNTIVLAVRRYLKSLTGLDFNSALLNYYRDGRDSVAWHADDEPELGSNPIIASVSFGAERMFELKHKVQVELPKYQIRLRNGSILLMGNTLQNNWVHQLPKTKSSKDPRINLTFRNIIDQ